MGSDINEICSRFDNSAKKVVVWAQAASMDSKIDCIYPESFMVAILGSGKNAIVSVMSEMGVDLHASLCNFKKELRAKKKLNKKDDIDYNNLSLSKEVLDICKKADSYRVKSEEELTGIFFIFMAILKRCKNIKTVLEDNEFDIDDFLKIYTTNMSQWKSVNKNETVTKTAKVSTRKKTKKGAISDFCVDVTEMAEKDELDPIVSRDMEIEQILTILCRRTKNNPILLGEPGVGKTAIVEGVAQRIVSGSVPKQLKKCRILSLSLTNMVAGTKYRGEFEKRMQLLVNEITNNADKYIVFIDEIHMLVGAGSAGSGIMDASNILKPFLARSDLKCIGATTLRDFKKYFSKDGALVRRFQQVKVDEPDHEKTKAMLCGIKDKIEKYHKCIITSDAIDASITMSEKFMSYRNFPDKAIDCLDIACAKHAWDEGEVKTVTMGDIAKVISDQCGVPLEMIMWDNNERLTKITENLEKNVFGQKKAIEAVGRTLKNAYSGVRDPDRPIGSFVFGGETGTGKTYMAEKLSEAIFGNGRSIIRLDMSEFAESFTASRIIGSPPGYVGFQEVSPFIDKVRRQPYCVILLDEIEKAHPDVMKLFLQVLSSGKMSDSTGNFVNFKNAIIIMTGNFGINFISKTSLGFKDEKKENKIQEAFIGYCKKLYGVEFVNRIDEFILFENLGGEDIKKIIDLMIDKLVLRLHDQNCNIVLKPEVYDFILNLSKSEHGKNATQVKRIISKQIEPCIADALLTFKEENRDKIKTITLYCKKDKLTYSIRRSKSK